MNSAEVQTPVPRPRCSKVSDPSAQVSSEGSSNPLPKPVMTAQMTTIGTTEASARPIRPSPERPKGHRHGERRTELRQPAEQEGADRRAQGGDGADRADGGCRLDTDVVELEGQLHDQHVEDH